MKAIYLDHLYHVVDDFGDGLILADLDPDMPAATAAQVRAPFSTNPDDLIIDPTDYEIAPYCLTCGRRREECHNPTHDHLTIDDTRL